MGHITTTPFGRRPVTAGLIEQVVAMQATPEIPHVDKWKLLRDLCTARRAFDVTDRDLVVLNVLVSFYPNTALAGTDNLIVFPSNASLSDRTHGMAESTLRRHLATLVHPGLIAHHDSPNGKRYARRDVDGEITRVLALTCGRCFSTRHRSQRLPSRPVPIRHVWRPHEGDCPCSSAIL